MTVGQTKTVTLDLLNVLPSYTSAAILSKLVGGLLTMSYQDDAIISSATLTLTAVPEPATFGLFGAALAAIGVLRFKRRT
jgi:hypothetical protein